MIVFLSKSDAIEGFEQIIDFLNTSVIHIDCLPNEEIFAELARIGVGKGFSGVDTPLLDGILVPQHVHDDVADDVADADTEPTLPLPTPATTPPPQQELIPLPSQVESTPPPSPHQSPIAQPSSPQPQQPPSHDAKISMTHMCYPDQERGIAKLDADEDVTLEEVDDEKDAEVQGRLPESQAQVYHLDLKHAQKVLSMQKTNKAELFKVEEVLEVVTAAKLMIEVVTTATTPIIDAPVPKESSLRRRRGVIIQDPKEAATASLNVQLEKGEKEIEEEESKLSKRKSENLELQEAKKQKIDEEVEELKTHLQIVPNDEYDLYTEATPLALKVLVVD
nr:hypothetical protein [Tanacetum cinerariifolium]